MHFSVFIFWESQCHVNIRTPIIQFFDEKSNLSISKLIESFKIIFFSSDTRCWKSRAVKNSWQLKGKCRNLGFIKDNEVFCAKLKQVISWQRNVSIWRKKKSRITNRVRVVINFSMLSSCKGLKVCLLFFFL